MSNANIALWSFGGVLTLVVVLAQLSHISPDGTIRMGLKVVFSRIMLGLGAAFSSLAFLEVVKNVSQALLFAGPSVYNIFMWKMALDEQTQLYSLLIGILVSIVILAVSTWRIEKLR